jgi:hypothetical protein
MAHHHSYAVEVAAFYLSAIPTLAVAGLIVGAATEGARRRKGRASKPASEASAFPKRRSQAERVEPA